MLQRPCAVLAFLLVGAVFVVIPASVSAQAQPPAQSLDGLWLTDGYGELIEFQGDELHWFEITQVSCVPAGKMDWLAVDKKFRPQVTPATKPEELFRILSEMIEPLHDAHTGIRAKSIQQRFHGYRPAADPMQKKSAARITEIIEKQYVRGGLRDFCNKQLQFGMLNSSVGYLRIHSFSGYSEDKEFAKQLEALENALDAIFKDAAKWRGFVIDARINGGGSDVFGISIASRLATQDYLAYSKVTRNDIHDPDHRTPPQPVMVHVSQRPGFRGPVVLLTSADSVSAAETFTMAVLDRQPHVVRVEIGRAHV